MEMNTNDQEELKAYIAMCKCCLLAEVMKDCPVCRFNIGLAEEIKLADLKPLPIKTRSAILALSEA
jgi:hypothetical protein